MNANQQAVDAEVKSEIDNRLAYRVPEDVYDAHKWQGHTVVVQTIGEARPLQIHEMKRDGLIVGEEVVFEDGQTEDGEPIYTGRYEVKGAYDDEF